VSRFIISLVARCDRSFREPINHLPQLFLVPKSSNIALGLLIAGANMTKLSRTLLGGVVISVFTGLPFAAQAACSVAGKWRAMPIAVGTEDQPGAGSLASGCQLTIAKNGDFSGTCRSNVLFSGVSNTTVSGNLTANSKCELSGVWQSPGVADAVVLDGYVSQDFAVFTAVRGNPAFQVRKVTLIKE
jgi:hypothetical protein